RRRCIALSFRGRKGYDPSLRALAARFGSARSDGLTHALPRRVPALPPPLPGGRPPFGRAVGLRPVRQGVRSPGGRPRPAAAPPPVLRRRCPTGGRRRPPPQ